MAFEKELPEWKATGIKPPSTKRNEGWKPSEKPPADWLNWHQNKTYEALKELQEKAAEASEVEGLDADLTGHIAQTNNVHGSTSAPTANRIIQRDAAGRAQVAAPSVAADIARKDTVDAVQANLDTAVTASPAATPLNLGYGLQVVNVPHHTPYNLFNIAGRTLINLLGRDGNFEAVANSTYFGGTATIDATRKAYGTNSIKIVKTAVNTIVQPLANKSIYPAIGDCFICIAEIYNENISTQLFIQQMLNGVTTTPKYVTAMSGFVTQVTGRFVPFISAFKIETVTTPGTSNFLARVNADGTSGHNINIDGFRIFRITQAEFDALGASVTEVEATQIAARYPYVDDMQAIRAPYVIKSGENLLPPFSEWTAYLITDKQEVESAYTLRYTKTTVAGYSSYLTNVPAVEGQSYNFSMTIDVKSIVVGTGVGVYYVVTFVDKYGVVVGTMSNAATNKFTSAGVYNIGINAVSPTNTTTIQVSLLIYDGTTAAVVFSNPMLNLGSTALPFKPNADDHLFFPDVKLASNVDGTITDTLGHWDGKYFKQARFKTMDLDGSLAWSHSPVTITGSKRVEYSNGLAGAPNQTMIKYDGKVLKVDSAVLSADTFIVAGGTTYVVIPNVDSGWGQGYSPLAAEISAYFYGWKMYNGADSNVPYTSGTKVWIRQLPRSSGNIDGTDYNVIVTPTNPPTGTTYKPYKLQYQLAQSTLEEIAVEGDITLHAGLNQIEVGNGMIVRESGAIQGNAANYYINGTGGSKLKYRVLKFLSAYKDGKIDKTWRWDSTYIDLIGNGYLITPDVGDNLMASYTTTYLALDQYSLTSNVQSIQGDYPSNLKTVVDMAVAYLADVTARVGVLENTKAQKVQPQWIAPTLLNGWVAYDPTGVTPIPGYRLNPLNRVTMKGVIKSGAFAVNTFICILPYKPKETKSVMLVSYSPWTVTTALISTNGELYIQGGNLNNVAVYLDNVTYELD
ncbi:hypothetical protein [Paenibacillus agricola]|uniref:Tail fiber protein n=1 Tax=Paenibacillus agricola TaxID=2716264 RepID=A0ABX0J5V1_9BACL|nr:hypothetical protein [Paenibacillus agricola]NHN29439.1 hypothetical protein [Paenibacillus agricola]